MCKECPSAVRDLADRIGGYIARHAYVIVGGLHIVIEDENVQTEDIQWCIAQGTLDEESQQFAVDLLSMSLPSRHAVVRFAWDDRERES